METYMILIAAIVAIFSLVLFVFMIGSYIFPTLVEEFEDILLHYDVAGRMIIEFIPLTLFSACFVFSAAYLFTKLWLPLIAIVF